MDERESKVLSGSRGPGGNENRPVPESRSTYPIENPRTFDLDLAVLPRTKFQGKIVESHQEGVVLMEDKVVTCTEQNGGLGLDEVRQY
jgi:hypothetical protein